MIASEQAQASYILRDKKEFIGATPFEAAQVNQFLSINAC